MLMRNGLAGARGQNVLLAGKKASSFQGEF